MTLIPGLYAARKFKKAELPEFSPTVSLSDFARVFGYSAKYFREVKFAAWRNAGIIPEKEISLDPLTGRVRITTRGLKHCQSIMTGEVRA